jgi:hypothetical protein
MTYSTYHSSMDGPEGVDHQGVIEVKDTITELGTPDRGSGECGKLCWSRYGTSTASQTSAELSCLG